MKIKKYSKNNKILYQSCIILKKLFNKHINLSISKIFDKIYYILNFYKIKKYTAQKIQRKNVVYTCISGPYDFLKNFKYFDKDWDYICYTNQKKLLNKKQKGIWKIYNMEYDELDQIRNARWHKVFPNKLFGDRYEQSIWIDGNVIIKNKIFFEKIKTYKKLFVSAIHPSRNCIYEEAEMCKKLKKDNNIIIDNQINELKKLGCPENIGLYESNIIYRVHNNKIIKLAMEDWWFWIKNYSRRDQLSLNYICWKNKIEYNTFNTWSYRKINNEIKIVYH